MTMTVETPHYRCTSMVMGRFRRANPVGSPATNQLIAPVARGDRALTGGLPQRMPHTSGGVVRVVPPTSAPPAWTIAANMSDRIDDLTTLQVNENNHPRRGAGAFLVGYAISHQRYFASVARGYAFEFTGPLTDITVLATGVIRKEPFGCARALFVELPDAAGRLEIGDGALAAGNTVVEA
jgi:acyl-CoA reductase-like NAD-dependent aldehyde dehydrogenase